MFSTDAQLRLCLVLMVALSAAERTRLCCDVSVRPRGQVQYRLRPEPGPDSASLQNCTERGFEDGQKRVLTLDSDWDQDRVQSFTDWTLDLKECLDFAHFTGQCPDFVEAFCRTDCRALMAQSLVHPDDLSETEHRGTQNSSCGSSCVALISVGAVLLGLLASGLIIWKFVLPVCRRRREPYSQVQVQA